jgi:hypothetical protein
MVYHLSSEQIQNYIENQYNEEESKVIKDHLEKCQKCRQLHSLTLKVGVYLHDYPITKTSDNFIQNILEKIPDKQFNLSTFLNLKPKIIIAFIFLITIILSIYLSAVSYFQTEIKDIINTYFGSFDNVDLFLNSFKNEADKMLSQTYKIIQTEYFSLLLATILILGIIDIIIDRVFIRMYKR